MLESRALRLDRAGELGQGGGRGADRIGEAELDAAGTAIDGGLGGAHRLGCQPAVAGDQRHQLLVEAIDIGLDLGAGTVRERLVRVAVDLAGAGMDEAPAVAGLGIGAALVEVGRDHADRADLAGAGDPEPVGGAGDGVGRRQRVLARHRPQRLAGGGLQLADGLDQVEQPADLAAGRVDLQEHGPDRRIGHGLGDLGGQLGVAGEPAGGIEPARAGDQRADHRDHGDALGRDHELPSRRCGLLHRQQGPGAEQARADGARITSSFGRAIRSGVPSRREARCGRSGMAAQLAAGSASASSLGGAGSGAAGVLENDSPSWRSLALSAAISASTCSASKPRSAIAWLRLFRPASICSTSARASFCGSTHSNRGGSQVQA